MKSSVLLVLALLLATAILAPSMITLSNLGENSSIAFDFNEEEKKEEKKEAKEKDFFLDENGNSLTQILGIKDIISDVYLENDYATSLAIFLPPPEHTL